MKKKEMKIVALALALLLVFACIVMVMASPAPTLNFFSPPTTPALDTSITILNPQSYPSVGENGTVRFNTTGKANLTITAVNGTTWSNDNEDNDLQLREIKCGNKTLDYVWINNSVFIENYECDETGYEVSKVLTPGKHTLEFRFGDDVTYTQEQDFTLGVLAINTHKSIYLPDETAFIGIAVLDNEGHMVCDADITVTITDQDKKETVLSTGNGSIKVSSQCCVYGVTNLPDYYTSYRVNGTGTYVMNLTAVTADGTKSITDNFTVQSSVDFDVARDGPTRIYPPVPYVMNYTIKANEDDTGLIKEYVPASFVITPQDGLTVTTVGDTKILTWNKNFVTGETYNIYYEFDAPDISPYLFTLGELEIGKWKGVRRWMIASDSPDTAYYDPTSDVQIGCDVTPAGSRYAAVDDAVRDPNTPNVNDYISALSNDGVTDEHQVDGITESGNRAQINVSLQSGNVTKASYSLPHSSSAAWRYVEWTTSSVGTITGEFTIVNSGTRKPGNGTVYAWYLEVTYTPTWESYKEEAHTNVWGNATHPYDSITV